MAFNKNNPYYLVPKPDDMGYTNNSSRNIISNFGSGGGGGMDIENRFAKIEDRLTNIEKSQAKIETFLITNLEWLKDSDKDIKTMLNKADAELANSKRHTQIMVYTSYALVLASAFGIASIWFTTWSANNQILSTLTQLVQTLSK